MSAIVPYASWPAHTSMIVTLAFSPDGHSVASLAKEWDDSEDDVLGIVKIWESASGRLATTIKSQDSDNGLAFGPDGKSLLWGGASGRVFVYDINSGEHYASLDGHEAAVTVIAVAGDGDTIATGGNDGCIRVWSCSGRCTKAVMGVASNELKNIVYSLAFDSSNRYLLSGHFDGSIKVWSLVDGSLESVRLGHAGKVYSIAVSGSITASCGLDNQIRLWDSGCRVSRAKVSTKEMAMTVSFSADGLLLACASGDLCIRAPASGDLLATLQGVDRQVYCARFGPREGILASGRADGVLDMWRLEVDQSFQGCRQSVVSA